MLIVRRALVDRRRDDLGGELDLRARRVHRRELDVVDELARVRDGGARLPQHVLARGLQLVDDVDVRGRDEGVDPRRAASRTACAGRVDVGELRPREPGDHRALDLARDPLDGLEVARRGDREAGLDHVDAQPRELLGDLELLRRVQRDARRLLAVAQRRVEDQYSVSFTVHDVPRSFRAVLRLLLGWVCGSRGRHALFPPKGEEKRARSSSGMSRRPQACTSARKER